MKKNIPQQTNELEMMMLPISERTLTFGNELMLADNFNLPPIEEREIEVHLTPACPFKVMFTMIMICTRGYMRFRYNLQEYTLKAGTILIIQPNSFGECLEISKDFQVAYISYKDESYIEENSASILSQFRNKMTQQAVINVSEEKMNELLTIYRTIRKRIQEPYTEFTREALKGYMRVILADTYQELAKMMETNGTDYKKSRSKYLFEKFLNLVQQCYTKERSVTFYAETMYLTPKYLSQVIYQASGRHAGEWIKDYVILEAKILLTDFYKVIGSEPADVEELAGDSDTLAGLLLEIKGEFPALHEHITVGIYDFEILNVDRRRILKVKLTINEKA